MVFRGRTLRKSGLLLCRTGGNKEPAGRAFRQSPLAWCWGFGNLTPQLQAKPWTNWVGQQHSGGRRDQTHPQDISRELIKVLCALWYRLIRPHRLFLLQREEKETPVELNSKAPG